MLMMDPVAERFWRSVDFEDGSEDACWRWTRLLFENGYGQFWVGGRSGGPVKAHRWAYEHVVGEIPERLVLDHLCRVRSCVRPSHLEPVTPAENVRRGSQATKTHCVNGHPFDEENTYYRPSRPTQRECRACKRGRARKIRKKRSGMA